MNIGETLRYVTAWALNEIVRGSFFISSSRNQNISEHLNIGMSLREHMTLIKTPLHTVTENGFPFTVMVCAYRMHQQLGILKASTFCVRVCVSSSSSSEQRQMTFKGTATLSYKATKNKKIKIPDSKQIWLYSLSQLLDLIQASFFLYTDVRPHPEPPSVSQKSSTCRFKGVRRLNISEQLVYNQNNSK